MKVREHRQELNKFMKEVRARDPARRMVTMMMMMILMMMMMALMMMAMVMMIPDTMAHAPIRVRGCPHVSRIGRRPRVLVVFGMRALGPLYRPQF